MKAVITVIGHDHVGIIAKVSSECSKYGANIVDISQTVMQDYFAMIMLADMETLKIPFSEFNDKMNELAEQNALKIHTMHEEIFDTMHRI
ncbi:MAG: ACT domain-containing protein [Clostridia bacterium]|nr:ACT domain-containing protein [Clostridia bacterium]